MPTVGHNPPGRRLPGGFAASWAGNRGRPPEPVGFTDGAGAEYELPAVANEDADPASHAVLAPSRRWPSAGHALAALAVYAVLVAALTWPLLPNAAVRMPATFAKFHFDTLHTAWMLSHESHALAAPWTVLDAQIYHPEPRTLFYSTLSLGLLPYFAPVYLATGNPTLALNLAFLGCVALTAWTIHLVVWRWTGDALAAGAGAVTFLVTRTLLWGFVSCAPYFGVLQYQPLLVYAAAAPASALATSPWLAALIALQCIADPLYVTPAVLLPLGVLALWRLRRRETRAAGWRLVRQLVVAGVLLAPVYAGYLDVVVRNPQLGSQSLYAARRAAGAPDVAGDPLPLSLLAYGHVIGWWNRFPVAPVALALVAIGAASVVVARARRAPDVLAAWRQCGYWALFAFLLPLLQNFGGVLRGMPRAGLVGLVALALLTGLAAAECAGRLRARLGSAAAAAALGAFVGLLAARAVPHAPRRVRCVSDPADARARVAAADGVARGRWSGARDPDDAPRPGCAGALSRDRPPPAARERLQQLLSGVDPPAHGIR